ncbi:hypothetical protein M885DRAFT_522087 [Pelagophyceae sp. CCMP2097]|nr:hypothetical protein M885DRAFT_522087 [Pelagophyceae sp. CCMP2097]
MSASLLRRCAVIAAMAVAVFGAQRGPRDSSPRRRNDARAPQDRRPRCDEYMQKHWALSGGGFLTRDKGRWHLRPDGSRAYDVEPCKIVRYVPEDARRCLKGRSIFMIGDSVTRYQTMSLIHFLERSAWPDRLPLSARRCQLRSGAPRQACGKTPNICVEGDWRNGSIRNWPNMLAQIGGGEDGAAFHGRVECLCARDTGPFTVQNVLYRGASQVNVSFLEQTGHSKVHGWKPTGCADRGTCRYSPKAHDANVQRSRNGDYAWSEPILKALEGPLPSFYPDVTDVIYNRGLWAAVGKEEASALFPRLKHWAAGPSKRCFWKGTTSDGGHRKIDEGGTRKAAIVAGCDVFDLQHMTQAFESLPYAHPKPPDSPYNNREREDIWWDSVHFMPWVYEEINNLLLNVLCNANTSWERS